MPEDIAISVVKFLIDSLFGTAAIIIAAMGGAFLTLLMNITIKVAMYSDFINNSAIIEGWIVVRDVCNMFFILILLLIAFATILQLENYSMKRWLPKLILMVIFINFSRMIVGLLIDASQIVMLTFVSSFSDSGGSWWNLFNVNSFLTDIQFNEAGGQITPTGSIAAYFMGVVFIILSCVAMIAILMIFVMRIIMLWIYTVLSPLGFFLLAFPGGSRYSSKYWGELSKYLINGPVLAFFIWLAMSTITKLDVADGFNIDTGIFTPSIGPSITEPANLIRYVLALAFLGGGLMISSEVGGAGASWGAGAVSKLKSRGVSVGKGATTGVVTWGGRKLDTLQMYAQKKAGVEQPRTLNYRMIAQGWKAKKAKDMEKYETYAGPHGSQGWHDTFGKWVRVKQYTGIGKRKSTLAQHEARAQEIDAETSRLNERVKNSALGDEVKKKKRLYYANDKNKAEIKDKYYKASDTKLSEQQRRDWAQEQYDEDVKSFDWGKGEVQSAEKTIDMNTLEVAKLRKRGIGSARYRPIHSESGAKEMIDKEIRDINQRSDDDYAVISELIEGYETKNNNRVVAAFQVLAKNNDLNEALKDNRVRNLMMKDNGLLDTLHKEKLIKGDIKEIKKDYRDNPVSPAYAQALIQSMFKETGLDDKMAARYANQIGSTSFASGNSLAYGIASGDTVNGGYKFDEMKFEKGKLQASNDRVGAIIGKFSNLESQAKMRTAHPDIFIKEAADGSATGISEEGKQFIKNLTGHDIGQINRLRLDVIRKIGGSDQALEDLNDIVAELVAAGDDNKADLVRYFKGYIKSRYDGKGLDGEKGYNESMRAYYESSNEEMPSKYEEKEKEPKTKKESGVEPVVKIKSEK